MKIIVKKGLNIPLAGKPENRLNSLPIPQQIALNLAPFDEMRFKVLGKVGDAVKIGTPLVESKTHAGLMFVSPGCGVITEIRRGLKRSLLDIVIQLDSQETYEEHGGLDLASSSPEEIVALFMRGGILPHITLRPFDLIASPTLIPRDIFVTALETRPFLPPYEMQVEGNEHYFQVGLNALTKVTPGKVHLVYSEQSTYAGFIGAENVEKHTVQGPHPAGMSSVHIHHIAPIRRPDDYVWSLTALGVVIIGKMVLEGRYHSHRVLSLAGNGVLEGKRELFKGREGYPVKDLVEGRLTPETSCLISGDPLTGDKIDRSDFLGFYHTGLSVIPENTERELFHFFRPGFDKYSATRAYLTGHIPPPKEGFPFTTNQHGEERAFIDGAIYDRVMPMKIPTMHLIKAILAEDFELADQLGLLEVVPEDFALPTFICPSKIEMIDIVKKGLHHYSQEMGH